MIERKTSLSVKRVASAAIVCLVATAFAMTDQVTGEQPSSLVGTPDAPGLDRGLAGMAPAGPNFTDVPTSHRYYHQIEALYRNGYVAGCSASPRRYCPDQDLTRAEMAVFVVRGVHGAAYYPPEPTVQIFDDVPLGMWYTKWVHQLYADGFTAGCSTDPFLYCPMDDVKRAEAAVFFLRMLRGRYYEPPATPAPGSPRFTDVPSSAWYHRWVYDAYNNGLLRPCDYTSGALRICPLEPVNRGEAADMMVIAIDLAPPASISRYIGLYGRPGMDLGDMREFGRAAARDGETFVILDFGDPYVQNGTYGTRLVNSAEFADTSQIAIAAERFITGWWNHSGSYSDPHLTLAIGTNNTRIVWQPGSLAREHGEAWALLVEEVDDWVGNAMCYDHGAPRPCSYKGRVTVAGAMDIEPWGNPDIVPGGAKDWVDAYVGATDLRFYNFGTCEDFQVAPSTDPDEWNLYWCWYFSWGVEQGTAYPVPEIYGTTGTHAQAWQEVSKYGATQRTDGRIYFPGVLTQWGGCRDRPSSRWCVNLDNRPQEAWVQLFVEIYDDPDTRVGSLPWTTDIRCEDE